VVLDVREVTRKFGGLVANNNMSLKVMAGEVLALIGPNGAGKSTLFNQISGVDTPTSGSVQFRGHEVAGRGSRHIAGLGMSRSFQHVRLMPRMTVLENVAIGAYLRGQRGVLSSMLRLDRQEEARILAEAARQIERVGLKAQMYEQAGALSLGQQRILEIARAGRRSLPAVAGRTRSGPAPGRSRRWATCCASCAARAWRSCWWSTTWTS
jgi:branched-chain amino acid transport system permease protein